MKSAGVDVVVRKKNATPQMAGLRPVGDEEFRLGQVMLGGSFGHV